MKTNENKLETYYDNTGIGQMDSACENIADMMVNISKTIHKWVNG